MLGTSTSSAASFIVAFAVSCGNAESGTQHAAPRGGFGGGRGKDRTGVGDGYKHFAGLRAGLSNHRITGVHSSIYTASGIQLSSSAGSRDT